MAHVTLARRGKVISTSNFAGYTHCYNPYVGCQYGCTYCYVRFFIRDDDHEWGDWVRVREHATEECSGWDSRLRKEMSQLPATAKIVLGTMTDPYQPVEGARKLTRRSLQILAGDDNFGRSTVAKVGIFTRSPMVTRDLDVISRLPRGRVHLTITPFDPELLKALEPRAVPMRSRFRTALKIKAAGVRLHINIAPAIPIISDRMLEELIAKLAFLQVDEFMVDPMQPYNESYAQVTAALQHRPEWPDVDRIMSDKDRYRAWKEELNARLIKIWQEERCKSPKTMAIACDHESKLKMDVSTLTPMNWATYDEYEMVG